MNEKIADCVGQDIIFKENTHTRIRSGTVYGISPSGKYVCIEESREDSYFDVNTITVLEVLSKVNVTRLPVPAPSAPAPTDVPIRTAGDPNAGKGTTTSAVETTTNTPPATT